MKPNYTLFHIFLLEDDDDLRADLERIVTRDVLGVVVDSEDCVMAAMERLERMPRPDLGILDVRVPQRRHGQPVADMRVWSRMQELKVDCLLITGYRDSDDVAKYLELTGPKVAVIDKRFSPDFPKELVAKIRSFCIDCASKRILQQIESFLGDSGESGRMPCGTAHVMPLIQCIRDYWPYLNESTRDRVRGCFAVDESAPDSVGFALFRME